MLQVLRPLIVGFALTAMGLSTASAQTHENRRWGFSVKAPSSWKQFPVKTGERWIVDKFLCKRAYTSEESYAQKPEMRVIVFPHSRTKRKTGNPSDDKDQDKADEKDEKKKSDQPRQRVYRNYREYLQKTYQDGGYFFIKEEPGEHDGTTIEMLEAKVDKNAHYGKKRIIAWLFHLQDCVVAVDFNCFEAAYKDVKRDCYRSLKSFKLIDRDPELAKEDDSSNRVTAKAEREMTPEERMRYRRDQAEQAIRRVEDTLPDGWYTMRSAHFFAASNASKKFTKKVIKQAEAIRGWLDENLPYVGEDYVPTAILRVCKTTDDENAYRSGSGDSWDSVISEITVSERSWDPRYEMQWIAGLVAGYWFQQRAGQLVEFMPPWLRHGVLGHIATGVVRGKRLVFKPVSWQRDALRTGEREGKILETEPIVKMTAAEFYKAERQAGMTLRTQCASLCTYLFSKRAQSKKKTKNIIQRYFDNLNVVANELIEKTEKKKDKFKMAETEEEELELRKKRRETAKKNARFIVDESYKRTFSDWDGDDWKKLHSSWKRAAL